MISRNARIYSADAIIIGNNVRIDDFCILSGKITLGSHIHISAFTVLYGGNYGIELKDYSAISSRCAVYAYSDDYSGFALSNPMVPDKFRNVDGGKVTLEKHALIGSGLYVPGK